jgi:hypothetical protein
MPRAVRTFAGVFVAGTLALLCIGLLQRPSEAFTLGVQPVSPLYLGRDATLCQGPIDVAADFSGVRLTVAAAVVSSPPASVRVLDERGRRELARGTLPGLRSETTSADIELDPVSEGRRVHVCLSGSGRGGLLVFGNADAAARGSTATIDGRGRERDIAIVFLRENRSSVLALADEIARRASLFHGGWVGTWTIWLAAVLLLTVVPVLLALALARAHGGPDDQPSVSASE